MRWDDLKFWKTSAVGENQAVIRYLQGRLVALVDQLKSEGDPGTRLDHYLPRVDRIITLFLELGHIFRVENRHREEAQVKAQAAKFLLVLPPQKDYNRLALAERLLREAIAGLERFPAGLHLADARTALGELLTRRAMDQFEDDKRLEILDEAEKHLTAALRMILDGDLSVSREWTEQAREKIDALYIADLYNKLGSLEKNRAIVDARRRDQHLNQALAHFQNALRRCSDEHSPDLVAVTHNNIGTVLVTLAGEPDEIERLREAETHFHAALDALDPSRQPHLHAIVHGNLGELLLSQVTAGAPHKYDLLQSALTHFGEALPAFPAEKFPLQFAKILYGQGRVLARLGEKTEARRLFKEALAFREHLPDRGVQIDKTLGTL